jgi:hypothetical protein
MKESAILARGFRVELVALRDPSRNCINTPFMQSSAPLNRAAEENNWDSRPQGFRETGFLLPECGIFCVLSE